MANTPDKPNKPKYLRAILAALVALARDEPGVIKQNELGWWRGDGSGLLVEIVFASDEHQFRLRASRQGAYPSAIEMRTLREALDIIEWESLPPQDYDVGEVKRFALRIVWNADAPEIVQPLALETPVGRDTK